VATLAWETSGLSGAFTLSAEVDPFGLLDEKDESNNALSRSVSVVSQRGVGLSVSTALSSYAPREDVEIRVEAVNGGASSPIPIETVVEDGIGTRLETLDRRSLVLPFGQSAAYTVFWNTGQSLAGTYRVRVLASGASASDELEIRRVLDVAASVVSNRPAYVQGDSATFFARLTNHGSNAPLRNVALHFEVAGELEASSSVPYVAMGATSEVSVVWPRIFGPPGPRTVTLRVLEGGEEIASASGSFDVRPATEVELFGTLSLGSAAVPAGSEIMARFEIENRGVVAVAGGSAPRASGSFDGPIRASGGARLDLAPGEM
jgi:hypothetical protein